MPRIDLNAPRAVRGGPSNRNLHGTAASATEPAPTGVGAAQAPSGCLTTDKLVVRFPWFTKNYWARLRCRGPGEGPEYLRVGNRILYREGDVLAWLASHRAATSTSETKRRRVAA